MFGATAVKSHQAGVVSDASTDALSFAGQGTHFWQVAALLLGVISLFRGIRLPNTWSATFALIDYDQGFVKRGLFGATLGRVLHLQHYANFCAFSYVVLALLFTSVVFLTRQSRVFQRVGRGEPVAIFAASFAVSYFGHLVGYLDIMLATCTVAVLLVRKPLPRCLVAFPVCVVCLLIHEMFLLTFLPVLLFSFILDAAVSDAPRFRQQVWAMCGVLAGLCVVVTLRLAAHANLTTDQVTAMTKAALARADYPVGQIVFSVFRLSGADNVHIMRVLFMTEPRYVFLWIVSLLTFALMVVPMLIASRRVVQTLPSSIGTRLLWMCTFVASLSPLLMNLLGYDNVRWNALVCLETLLVLLLLSRALPNRVVALPRWYRSVTILLLAVGMASGEGLMDEKEPHAFPFVSSTMHLVHAIIDEHRIPPPQH